MLTNGTISGVVSAVVSLAIGIVILTFVMSIGADLNDSVIANLNKSSDAYDVAVQSQQNLLTLSEWTDTIVTVLVAVLILSILITFFMGRSGEGF
jgi:flagellar biosynthesis protein FlhB